MRPGPSPSRIVLCRPRGRGGVASVVDQLYPSLSTRAPTTLLPVGRRGGERLGARAIVRDGLALRRALPGAAVVHLHPSLRARAIVRDAILHDLAQRAGCPTVVQLHGFDRRLVAWLGARARARAALLGSLLSADALLVLGRPFVHQLVGLGVPPERIHVVANPFDPATIPTERIGGAPLVLYLGRLVGGKGLPELIEAIGLLSVARPRLEVVIAGEGPLEPALRSLVRARGLSEQVRFVGWVQGAAKVELLARASVLALVSGGEAAPVSVIEALASGVPVVATRTGAIPELVGPAGVILDRAEPPSLAAALTEVLDDPGRGSGGPAQVADCTLDRITQRLIRLYRDLGARIEDPPGVSEAPGLPEAPRRRARVGG